MKFSWIFLAHGFFFCIESFRIILVRLVGIPRFFHISFGTYFRSMLFGNSQKHLEVGIYWPHIWLNLGMTLSPAAVWKTIYGCHWYTRCAIGSINSHYFHIIGDCHQPNSRGLYTHYKDSLLKVGFFPSPMQGVEKDPGSDDLGLNSHPTKDTGRYHTSQTWCFGSSSSVEIFYESTPPTTNMVHLKMNPWKRRFPGRNHHFQVNHVSFSGVYISWISQEVSKWLVSGL